MRYKILAGGTHGDIRPFVAIGLALKERGYDVCMITDEKSKQFCQEWGLDHLSLIGNFSELVSLNQLERNKNPFAKMHILKDLLKLLNHAIELQFKSLCEIIKEADVIIYHPSVLAASHIAEKWKIPAYRMLLQPEVRTKFHPSSVLPIALPFGKIGNLLSHLICEQLFWQPIRKKINSWRQTFLALPKINFFGHTYNNKTIVAISSTLIPRPSDWKPNVFMTGFARLKAAEKWEAPSELKHFFDQGRVPICIGFGSLNAMCPKHVLISILECIKINGLRAILLGDYPCIDSSNLPESVLQLTYAPHDWLFPKVSAVIHHGGIGTTAAGLHAGKPTLILPFILDQFLWGKKIHQLGLGPKPISVKNFSQKNFLFSLNELLHNEIFRCKAEAIAEKLSEEDGVKQMIDMIEHDLISRK